MTQIKIIMPTGAFGSSSGEHIVTTAMRIIGVGFGEEGDWSAKYGTNAETDIFSMRSYYWGDCDCGADERSEAFEASDPGHSADCYQTVLNETRKAAGISWYESKPYVHHEGTKKDRSDKIEDRIYADLCARFGLSKRGCAVHCTCGCGDRYKAADIGHRDTCALELPNFVYKPTGFALTWYKYIGRDMEVKVEAPLPNDFMDSVFSSHPSGMTLEQAIKKTAEQEEETAASFAQMFATLRAG